MEQKSLQQWLNFIDSAEAPRELNEEFNKVFHTKGVQYPMKLFSIYILKKEIAKGNLSAIKLEATMKGTLSAEAEDSMIRYEAPTIVNLLYPARESYAKEAIFNKMNVFTAEEQEHIRVFFQDIVNKRHTKELIEKGTIADLG